MEVMDEHTPPSQGAAPMRTAEDPLAQRQREALWKWRWLGWRDSTPAFKASLALLAVATVVLGVAAYR
jgi:hypothetical protein